ncbi:hypothetical protein L9F63_007311, partial [Diploptera punctata]
MPKRICPFDYDLIPQQKIHISEKEIEHGDTKKIIYDKTLKMLFKGAQNHSNSAPCVTLHEVPKISRVNYKQLMLDNHCNLRPGGSIRPVHKSVCSSCVKSKSEMNTSCGFCDVPLCVDCCVKCRNCSDEFCRSCSFPV